MPQLEFFAAHDDHAALLEFLFEFADLRIFESYSEYDQELREFRSLSELETAFRVGSDPYGNGYAFGLTLWLAAVSSQVQIDRIDLDSRRCQGHTFRYTLNGKGLIHLHFGGVHENCEVRSHRTIQPCRCITKSHFSHFSEPRPVAEGWASGVDWGVLGKLSNKIQYHIRNRLAAAKVPGRPVLRHALELASAGYPLREGAGMRWQYETPQEKTR
jgi:hypothetical protein